MENLVELFQLQDSLHTCEQAPISIQSFSSRTAVSRPNGAQPRLHFAENAHVVQKVANKLELFGRRVVLKFVIKKSSIKYSKLNHFQL